VGQLSRSVAAGLLAATLIGTGCREEVGSGSETPRTGSPSAENAPVTAELSTEWLIPPDPALDPPLASPVGIAADESGERLLVMELQPPELRAYHMEDGRLLEVLGREGDGPGEYRHPIALAVNGEGRAAVLSVSGRVTFWNRDGGLAGIVDASAGLAPDIMAARGDTFYVKSDLFPPDDVSEFRAVVLDTVLANPLYRDFDLVGTDEPGRRLRNHGYAVAATADGDLLLSPPGVDFVILRIGPDGKVRQTIKRPEVPPLRRSAEEIEAIRQRIRQGFAAAGRVAPDNVPVTEYRSHVARLAAATDGSIWALTQRGDSMASILDVFGADGRFAGSYKIGLRVTDISVTSKSVFVLARGDLDLPAVAVARRPTHVTKWAGSR
jgi:hypothetical protein